jgi:hypothetical protein
MLRRTSTAVAAAAGLAAAALATAPAHAQTVTITPAAPQANYPHLAVITPSGDHRTGYIFAGPKFDGARPDGAPVGPMILDDHGRPVWFMNLPGGERATDVRQQIYDGKPVVTFWQGSTGVNPGVGVGNDLILNQHYKVIRTVHFHGGPAGQMADQHEFQLTPGGTALIVGYEEARVDASAVGGSVNQDVLDGVVQEIDLSTAQVVFEWHSLTHVPLKSSFAPAPAAQPDTPWDYFHINSVKIDTDHNLLISGRHTDTVYKVDRHTGQVIWRMGGKNSSFAMGPGTAFTWQHDAEAVRRNVYRVFDNRWNQIPSTPPSGPESRVLYIRVDPNAGTATRVRHIEYPGTGLLAGSQGNAQSLPNGNVLVNWGAADHITEFTPANQLIFDASFPAGYNSYRAYRAPWVGTPSWNPFIRLASPGGNLQFDVLWNGAGTVARWRLLGGPDPAHLSVLGSIRWNGYDTAFQLSSVPAYISAVALDARGAVLGRTGVRPTS